MELDMEDEVIDPESVSVISEDVLSMVMEDLSPEESLKEYSESIKSLLSWSWHNRPVTKKGGP